MSIMSNVVNKRTMINTEHETRWQLIYKRQLFLNISYSSRSEDFNARRWAALCMVPKLTVLRTRPSPRQMAEYVPKKILFNL